MIYNSKLLVHSFLVLFKTTDVMLIWNVAAYYIVYSFWVVFLNDTPSCIDYDANNTILHIIRTDLCELYTES